MTTECTEHGAAIVAVPYAVSAVDSSSTLIGGGSANSEDNVIEDLFTFTSDFWAPATPIQSHPDIGGCTKVRLNSFEDQSLSCSPESGFSNRSRISSGGEDDLEVTTWKNNKVEHWTSVDATVVAEQQTFDPSLTELNAILDQASNTESRMEFSSASAATAASAQQANNSMSDQQQLEWTYLEPAQPTFNVVEGLETIVTTNAGRSVIFSRI